MADFLRGRAFELSEAQKQELRGTIDASSYSLAEWEEAFRLVYAWLAQRGRHESFERVRGYLICCADAAAREPLRPFWQVVRDMLTQHGVDA